VAREWAQAGMSLHVERAGGCVCGAVRFVTRGEPKRVTLCHCLWCQRRTGTAFGTEVVFPTGHVSLSGETLTHYRHHSDESGRWLDVCFCGRCGCNLGFTLEAVPEVRTIPAGCFDDPTWIAPDAVPFRHVFTRSRRAWGTVSEHVEAYEHYLR